MLLKLVFPHFIGGNSFTVESDDSVWPKDPKNAVKNKSSNLFLIILNFTTKIQLKFFLINDIRIKPSKQGQVQQIIIFVPQIILI